MKGAVPGTNGAFVRIVDAVKGPFSPAPLPVPTFELPPDFDRSIQLLAPVAEKDAGIIKEPEDPY